MKAAVTVPSPPAAVRPVMVVQIPSSFSMVPGGAPGPRVTPSTRTAVGVGNAQLVGAPHVLIGDPTGRIPVGGAVRTVASQSWNVPKSLPVKAPPAWVIETTSAEPRP